MSIAPLPPVTGVWTPEDYDDLPADNYRREMIDGVLHLQPPPSGQHQATVAAIWQALYASAPSGYVAVPGVEVRLGPLLRYVPDVLVVTADGFGDGRTCRYDPEDVVLVVEVVSDSSRSMDRVLKPHHYAAARIPFYWRVELEPRLTVSTHMTDLTGEYQQTGEFDEALTTAEPWSIAIDLTKLPN